MRFSAGCIIFAMVVLFGSGCEVIRLSNGKYETTLSGRDDFAAVYKDMIILRLRNPQNENGTDDGYWDWGGKYEITDENRIELNMSREEARRWDFYYDLRKQDNAIKVTDHRAENSFRLEYIPAVPSRNLRKTPSRPSYY
ncbi:MAG: hypothetical protein E7058_09605 [Lentisphaerae bacterium]|nr:hypothetical protein [Lentisphaerota bacterium]